jgi:hypothetical protein
MLKKLTLKSGVNRENTRYQSENGWWAGDKIRFRQGTPERIGGWARISENTFLGRCRALFAWITHSVHKQLAVGTHLKYYIEFSGSYYDVTPIRLTAALTDPFTTTSGSPTVVVTHTANGSNISDFVTFSGATAVGGLTLNGEFQVAPITVDSYSITALSNATSSASGGGTVTAVYQIHVGLAAHGAAYGWGASFWGSGSWGTGTAALSKPRMWSQYNYGEDLVFAERYGAIYYWTAAPGLTGNPGVLLSSMPGAADVPVVQTFTLVSDVSRFIMAFGCSDIGGTTLDPLLIRWCDQENATMWTPSITNQAGGISLSHGSEISTALQIRQEILVWTDVALYSLQYLGAPLVWGTTILADGVSCVSPNGVAVASGVVYWMGLDKFYKYDGTVTTLPCDLRQYIFGDIATSQPYQIFAGTDEAFNEVWWFYCASGSTSPDRYVIFNYLENVWYYGTMNRTAWIDTGLEQHPRAAADNKIVYHDYGVDDASNAIPVAIPSYIESAEFDIDDGDHFGFVWRMLPDMTFAGSTSANPAATITLIPMVNSGSGGHSSVAGSDNAGVTRTATAPIEEFTGQVFIRVRGRQLMMRIDADQLGTTWQLGGMRLDIKPDGRRG